jgi:hypothetical protein
MTRQRCEVWSRVVGFFRPVRQWNPGKQKEFEDRKEFNEWKKMAEEKVGSTREWGNKVDRTQ